MTPVAYLRGPEHDFELQQNPNGHWQLGSGPEADVCLNAAGVLPLHAKLERNGILWKLSAIDSSQLPRVNGAASPMGFLKAGDTIGLGEGEWVFEPAQAVANSQRLDQAALAPKSGAGYWPLLIIIVLLLAGFLAIA